MDDSQHRNLTDFGLLVVGVGVSPRGDLTRDAGLTTENGIVVDEFLRTNAPSVVAAGDITATWNSMYNRRIRVEHGANALNQGQTATRQPAESE
jgi:3-phenylpropionate/trans-cinnamate dioxygenase ferredoxin reductase subunit